MLQKFKLSTHSRESIVEITDQVARAVEQSQIEDGAAIIYSPHTTTAVTINENADPDVRRDLVTFFNQLVPNETYFRHMEGNSDAHVKSSMIGCSETVLVENSRLVLGRWQGIYFCDFDGPRQRQCYVKILKG